MTFTIDSTSTLKDSLLHILGILAPATQPRSILDSLAAHDVPSLDPSAKTFYHSTSTETDNMPNDELITDEYVAGLLAKDAQGSSLKYPMIGTDAYVSNNKKYVLHNANNRILGLVT